MNLTKKTTFVLLLWEKRDYLRTIKRKTIIIAMIIYDTPDFLLAQQ